MEVDLVGAEGGPDVSKPLCGLYRGEQRKRARPHHLRQVNGGVDLDKVAVVGSLVAPIGLEPRAMLRNVVGHEVEHQPVAPAQPLHVLPVPQRRVDPGVVDHRKAIVRGVREARQDMHPADALSQFGIQEISQRL